jgi:hypothetical protein
MRFSETLAVSDAAETTLLWKNEKTHKTQNIACIVIKRRYEGSRAWCVLKTAFGFCKMD